MAYMPKSAIRLGQDTVPYRPKSAQPAYRPKSAVPVADTRQARLAQGAQTALGVDDYAPIPVEPEVITPGELGRSYPEVASYEHAQKLASRWAERLPVSVTPPPGLTRQDMAQIWDWQEEAPVVKPSVAEAAPETTVGEVANQLQGKTPGGPTWRQEIHNALERGGLRVAAGVPGTAAAVVGAIKKPGTYEPPTTMESLFGSPDAWKKLRETGKIEEPAREKIFPEAAKRLQGIAKTIYDDSLRSEIQPQKKGVLGYIANTTFDTLPLMALSTASAIPTGGLGAFVTAAMAEGESAYQEAKRTGATEEQAQLERLIVGTINGVIERAQADQILSFGKDVGKDALRKLAQSARDKAWGKLAKQVGQIELKHIGKAINEGLEETAQEAVQIGAATIHGEQITWGAVPRLGQAGLGGLTAGYGLTGAAGVSQAVTDAATRERAPTAAKPTPAAVALTVGPEGKLIETPVPLPPTAQGPAAAVRTPETVVHTMPSGQVMAGPEHPGAVPGSEKTVPAVGAKEPWQMTRAEYRDWIIATEGPAPGVPPLNLGDMLAPKTGIHRLEVEQALAKGLPVPPEVLAEYPDLQQEVPRGAATVLPGLAETAAKTVPSARVPDTGVPAAKPVVGEPAAVAGGTEGAAPGQRLTLYHGTDRDVGIQDLRAAAPQYEGSLGEGIYFGQDRPTAEFYGKNVLEVPVRIANPLVIDAAEGTNYRVEPGAEAQRNETGDYDSILQGEQIIPFDVQIGGQWVPIRNAEDLQSLSRRAKAAGHDALIVRGIRDNATVNEEVVAFDRNQIGAAQPPPAAQPTQKKSTPAQWISKVPLNEVFATTDARELASGGTAQTEYRLRKYDPSADRELVGKAMMGKNSVILEARRVDFSEDGIRTERAWRPFSFGETKQKAVVEVQKDSDFQSAMRAAYVKAQSVPAAVQPEPAPATEAKQTPIEVVMLFDELRANRVEMNKNKTGVSRRAELIVRNKKLTENLKARGYEPGFIKKVEAGKEPVPAPTAGKSETKTPDDAARNAKKMDAQSRKARRRMAGGFFLLPRILRAKKPAVATGPLETAYRSINAALKKARRAAGKVHRQQRESRSKRTGAALGMQKSFLKKGATKAEAMLWSRAAHKGEQAEYKKIYPSVRAEIADDTMDVIVDRIFEINQQPETHWEGQKLLDAFNNLIDGDYLARFEVNLIRDYLPGLTTESHSRIPLMDRLYDIFMEAWNIPRAILAGFLDMSAIGRQSRALALPHPKRYAQFVAQVHRAFWSPRFAKALHEAVEESPWYEHAVASGLQIAQWGPGGVAVENREELYIAHGLLGRRRLIGIPFRASERAFVPPLNALRMAIAEDFFMRGEARARAAYGKAKDQGQSEEEALAAADQANWADAEEQNFMSSINDLSGRSSFGRYKAMQAMSPILTGLGWAPRFAVSRMKPPFSVVASAGRALRGQRVPELWQNLTGLGGIAGTLMGVTALAAMAAALWDDEEDVTVEPNTLSSDFGKIKWGNQRIDLGAGYLQAVRFLVQFVSGKYKDVTGEIKQTDRKEVLIRFLRTKSAPGVGLLVDYFKGQNYRGEPFGSPPKGKVGAALDAAGVADWVQGLSKESWERLVPLLIQDVGDALTNGGYNHALLALPSSFYGLGVQTYPPSEGQQVALAKNAIALRQHGQRWDNLTPRQQLRLRRQEPEIEALERTAKANRTPATEIDLKEEVKAAKAIKSRLSEPVSAAVTELGLSVGIERRIGEDFWLNDHRFQTYQEYTAKSIERLLSRRVQSARWSNRKDWDERRKMAYALRMQEEIDRARELARRTLLREIQRGQR